jgi:peptidoglycan hydrolase CwlO-like protein
LLVLAAVALAAPAASARAGQLEADRQKAHTLAVEITALDSRIEAAVQRFARATSSLQAVRRQIRDNTHLQRIARKELDRAKATLTMRAVSLYKNDDVSTLDALLTAGDFNELVTQMSMMRSLARGDRDVVSIIVRTERQLTVRAASLAADERTAVKLVSLRSGELKTIHAQLSDRRALLAGVRATIRTSAAKQERAANASGPTVQPAADTGGGQGQWWTLIQSAASARGVSARGMYRLMMIESGGSATAVGPGGYYGLFQYAPSTWKGSWNPLRSSSITDGAAQIKATALALSEGYGHAWWDPSYSWAFEGR